MKPRRSRENTRGRALGRAALLLAGLAMPSGVLPAPASAQTLRGSKASVEKMYTFATRNGLAFRATTELIASDAGRGRLVPLGGSLDYQLTTQIGWPYVTPETRRWVDGFAEQYAAVCQAPLVITSASRPLNRQPRNANPHSVHPAGIAVDLRRPPAGPCLAWTRAALVELERRGVIEATEERHPVHLHVAVLTEPGHAPALPVLRVAGQDPSAKRDAWLAVRQSYAVAAPSGTSAESSATPIASSTTTAPTAVASAARSRTPIRVPGVVVTEPATRVVAEAEGDVAPAGATASASPTRARAGTLATAEGAPAGARGRMYRVRPGDTLWDIARRNRTRVDALLAANHLRRAAALRPGDVLRLPESSGHQ